MGREWALVAYGGLAVLNAGLAALAVQLGAGKVPVPVGLEWAAPIAIAMLTTVTVLLPGVDALGGRARRRRVAQGRGGFRPVRGQGGVQSLRSGGIRAPGGSPPTPPGQS